MKHIKVVGCSDCPYSIWDGLRCRKTALPISIYTNANQPSEIIHPDCPLADYEEIKGLLSDNIKGILSKELDSFMAEHEWSDEATTACIYSFHHILNILEGTANDDKNENQKLL